MSHGEFKLLLFVAGDEPNSRQARQNLEAICGQELGRPTSVEIVDVTKEYKTALQYNVVVTPALVLKNSRQRVSIFGTLSDVDQVVETLQQAELDYEG